MKKLITIILTFAIGLFITINNVNIKADTLKISSYDETKWTQEGDYMYYNMPSATTYASWIVESPYGTILEYSLAESQHIVYFTVQELYDSEMATSKESLKANMAHVEFYNNRFRLLEEKNDKYGYYFYENNEYSPSTQKLRYKIKNETWEREGDYLYLQGDILDFTYTSFSNREKELTNIGETWGQYNERIRNQEFRYYIETPEGTAIEYLSPIYDTYVDTEDYIYNGGGRNKLALSLKKNNESVEAWLYRGMSVDTQSGIDKIAHIPVLWETQGSHSGLKRMFRYYDPIEVPDIPENPDIGQIEDLPKTSRSSLGIVKFRIDKFNLVVQISYGGKVTWLEYSFTLEQDMSIFNTVEAFYMNINRPQIIINHSDKTYLGDILTAPDNAKPAFVPHTTWDLNTNTINTKLQYKTNVYLKQNNKGVWLAYVYIDEYIIDTLLAAQVSWTSRQKNPKWTFGKPYTDWETHTQVLTNDTYLEYKNLTSDWQNSIPLWNVIRGIYQLSKTYEMPRIEAVNLKDPQSDYNITKNEVESHFRTVNKDFDVFNENERYKLWAFALQGGKDFWGIQTQLFNSSEKSDPRNFKIISMDYITNGVMYEADGNDMDIVIPDAPGLSDTENLPDKPSFLAKIAFFGITGLAIFGLFSFKAFRSPKRFFGILIGYTLVGLIVYLLYQYTMVYTVISLMKLLL